ncbi:MAG: DUF4114 domain-containing protein [Woeseiaceae bacterium]
MKLTKTIAAFAALFIATQANATPINGNGLQNGLDNITYGSHDGSEDADFRDVNEGQLAGDEIWTLSDTSISTSRLLFEFAGYRNANTFGIYDIYDTGNRLEIFNGAASSGAASVVLGANNQFAAFGITGGTFGAATFASRAFGFYLQGPGGIFFSQSNRNAGDADHMVTFQGNGSEYIDTYGYPTLFTGGAHILAWEDLPMSNGDGDYNDFVVMVTGVTAVPAPGTLALLGLGLIGAGFARKRA